MFELGQNVDAGTNINFKNIKIEIRLPQQQRNQQHQQQ